MAEKFARLDAVKIGLAAGIVTAICSALTILCSLVGMFPGYTELAIPWLEGIYGFVGFSVSPLGIVLGAVYSGIDVFIFTWLLALIYNKII